MAENKDNIIGDGNTKELRATWDQTSKDILDKFSEECDLIPKPPPQGVPVSAAMLRMAERLPTNEKTTPQTQTEATPPQEEPPKKEEAAMNVNGSKYERLCGGCGPILETDKVITLSPKTTTELKCICVFMQMLCDGKEINDLLPIFASYFEDGIKPKEERRVRLSMSLCLACGYCIAEKYFAKFDNPRIVTRSKDPHRFNGFAHWSLQARYAFTCECVDYAGDPCDRCLEIEYNLHKAGRYEQVAMLLAMRKYGRDNELVKEMFPGLKKLWHKEQVKKEDESPEKREKRVLRVFEKFVPEPLKKDECVCY